MQCMNNVLYMCFKCVKHMRNTLYMLFQAQMMKEYPRIVCVDGTHKLNTYGHVLLSLLVINGNGQGLVTAWAIASRENGTIWFIMCKNLRPMCVQLKPEVC